MDKSGFVGFGSNGLGMVLFCNGKCTQFFFPHDNDGTCDEGLPALAILELVRFLVEHGYVAESSGKCLLGVTEELAP